MMAGARIAQALRPKWYTSLPLSSDAPEWKQKWENVLHPWVDAFFICSVVIGHALPNCSWKCGKEHLDKVEREMEWEVSGRASWTWCGLLPACISFYTEREISCGRQTCSRGDSSLCQQRNWIWGRVVGGWWVGGGWVGGSILHFWPFEPQSMLPPRVTDLPVFVEWVGEPLRRLPTGESPKAISLVARGHWTASMCPNSGHHIVSIHCWEEGCIVTLHCQEEGGIRKYIPPESRKFPRAEGF